MDYVDGFVLAVPKANKQKYIEHAEEVGLVFKEYGALSIVDCWGDDIEDGEVTSLPMAVKCQEDEVVCFSWIVWPSKEARDKGMEAAFKDYRFAKENMTMPFDGQRMIYGGFNMIVKM